MPGTSTWDLLKENKNPAEQSFKMATLNILGDSQFEVITNNNLEQKFIEQEKRVLSEYLQKHFCNKTLHFAVKITEHPVEINFGEKTLSKKEQFMLMVQQYPACEGAERPSETGTRLLIDRAVVCFIFD